MKRLVVLFLLFPFVVHGQRLDKTKVNYYDSTATIPLLQDRLWGLINYCYSGLFTIEVPTDSISKYLEHNIGLCKNANDSAVVKSLENKIYSANAIYDESTLNRIWMKLSDDFIAKYPEFDLEKIVFEMMLKGNCRVVYSDGLAVLTKMSYYPGDTKNKNKHAGIYSDKGELIIPGEK